MLNIRCTAHRYMMMIPLFHLRRAMQLTHDDY